MRKKIVSLILLLVLLMPIFIVLPVTYSATEEDIENAVELGVEWLANQQNSDGSWGTVSKTARTALAVLKLIDRARELGYDYWDTEYNYSSHVEDGLNYLFSQAIVITISNQTAGNPDANNNSLGCYYSHQYSSTIIYESAIALMGIANTRTPEFLVNVSGSAVHNWTYGQVVQDTVDFMAYAQTEYSNAQGGWGYSINAVGTVDNSVSGYVALGLGYAKVFGSVIPDFVLTELEIWISIIQDPTGYSWYRFNWDHGDRLLKTGNLLYEMALVGYPLNHTRVQNAISYIESHWYDAMIGPDYQRQYCLMKGLEAYSIESLNVSGPFDWFDDIANWTLARLQTDGSYLPKDRHEYNVYSPPYVLTTTWALLTLEKSVAPPQNMPPVADAGPDQTFEQSSYAGAEVTLNGSLSYDPEEDPLTYNWTWLGGMASGVNPTVVFPLGTTTVTLIVFDGELYSGPDTVNITVQDTTPPVISTPIATPDTLWPPNHKYHDVEINVTWSDICDADPHVIVNVTSNEPINANGVGDGNTEPDWVIVDDTHLKLRAERDGTGTDRIYTITYEITDASGNIVTASCTVTVPHDKGKGK